MDKRMRIEVDIHKVEENLSRLIDQALVGDEVVITRDGKPVVRLTPIRKKRVPGLARGKIQIAPDFDDPLPDKILSDFEPD